MKGVIKWFNERKKFGFITGDDGKEYFIHASQINNKVVLKTGDSVSFIATETEKGLQARNITKC